jgi:hypothetical protein
VCDEFEKEHKMYLLSAYAHIYIKHLHKVMQTWDRTGTGLLVDDLQLLGR